VLCYNVLQPIFEEAIHPLLFLQCAAASNGVEVLGSAMIEIKSSFDHQQCF
jgi:hypothetical protein